MREKSFFRGSIWTVCLLVGCSSVSLRAQDGLQDSLWSTFSERRAADDMHGLRLGRVLVPAGLVGVSALCIDNGWLKRQRENVQGVLSARGKHRFRADDYIQYAPMAALYGLNLSGERGKHNFKDLTIILAMSCASMGILVNTMKYSFRERRPDSPSRNAFPSGHTATAFMGAEFLRREYRDVSPWIGYAGYAVALTTGYLRIYNDRHYINDVIAGACIGVLSAELAYWLYPKCFKRARCNERMALTGMPYCSMETYGLNMAVRF